MWGSFLVVAGLLWAAQAVIDPLRPWGSLLGPGLAIAGILLASRTNRRWERLLLPAVLAITFGVSSQFRLEFRADSGSYFAYLRSMVFDGDLDFANEWEHWGWAEGARTETGLLTNAQSVGPALLWCPAYLATHGYLVVDRWLTGTERYELEGYSAPYRRAASLTTLTFVVIGAGLLFQLMSPLFGARIALLAALASVLTSPVLYYAFVVPTMSHGVTFGAAAGVLWAWDRARRLPSITSWVVLGAALGLVTICRWQGAVYVLLIAPLAVQGLKNKSIRPVWLTASAGAALIVFSPQLVAWKILFGHWMAIPQGRGFLEFSSANLVIPLLSANRGFFNWTPVMFFGFVGLLLGLRRSLLLYAGSLLVFLVTAWINGSVPDYDLAAGDAFGARRFTLVVPLMTLGLAAFLEAARRITARAPLLVPAALLLLFFLWNIGLISHFRDRRYREMAPLADVAADQARSLQRITQKILGTTFGARGRALAYQIFSAEYFYTRFNRSGTIDLRTAGPDYLLQGWSTGSRRRAPRPFRRARFPEACVRIPLQEPFDLRTVVTARAPDGLASQTVTVTLNGETLTSVGLPNEWRDIRFTMPERILVPGENTLCLRFGEALPPADRASAPRVAAHVARIQLP